GGHGGGGLLVFSGLVRGLGGLVLPVRLLGADGLAVRADGGGPAVPGHLAEAALPGVLPGLQGGAGEGRRLARLVEGRRAGLPGELAELGALAVLGGAEHAVGAGLLGTGGQAPRGRVAVAGDDLHGGTARDERGDRVGQRVVVPLHGGQPRGDLVQREDVPPARVERPLGGVRAAVVEERQADAPGAVLALPGVPLDLVEVDAAPAEAFLDGLTEGRAGRGLAGTPDRDALRLLRHVLAFLQDRTLEPADALDGDARRLGDLLGGLAGPDAGLDLLGAQGTLHFDLELAEAGEVPTDRRAEPVVDGQGEPGASARGGQDEVRTVLADR